MDKIVNNGFLLKEFQEKTTCLISLRLALKAFFSTYITCKYSLENIFPGKVDSTSESTDVFYDEKENSDHASIYTTDYFEKYFETITHFQHFFELFLKSILREAHILLADIALHDIKILFKLLKRIELDENEENELRSIEFSEALDRVTKLINSDLLGGGTKYSFLKQHINALKKINILRNKILHRGKYILTYKAFDQFIGGYILPIIQDISLLDSESAHTENWKYKELYCKLDPINELIKYFQVSQEYNWKKIAWLKELGRAAYENPLYMDYRRPKKLPIWADTFKGVNNKQHISKAETINKSIASCHHTAILNCPVCGENTLNAFIDNYEIIDSETNEITELEKYIYEVKCTCCSFEINHRLNNAEKNGLIGINNFF